MAFSYGIIEGLYDPGASWGWSDRQAYVDFCQHRQFGFYIYAPKNDPWLREQWQNPWPEAEFTRLKQLSQAFQQQGVAFGIGLTPYQVNELSAGVRQQLKDKMALINDINPSMLTILFDDFANDSPGLAQLQCALAEYIAGLSRASQVQVVSTYYSRDPLLSRAYGAMPANYWADLGRTLDPRFAIFWTGDHVISPGYDQAGLEYMANLFQRQPLLWDNYPVNDPPWLQDRLRLLPFTARPWQLSQWCAGHAANPMVQPRLSMIPLATLADLYQQKDQFMPIQSLGAALEQLCGPALAEAVYANLVYLTEEGRDRFSDFTRNRLKTLFATFDQPRQQPFVRELLNWLEPGGL